MALTSRPPRLMFVGRVAYADAVLRALVDAGETPHEVHENRLLRPAAEQVRPDLIIVAGWRRLIPPDVLAIPRLGTVGFHSAKLPEYPGRAPVPWTLLRGDRWAWNTMLYLDEGVDTGDIVDTEPRAIAPGETPGTLYDWIAESSVRLLLRHLSALKAGTAQRIPQDMTKRGPLTTADGWARWQETR